MYECKIAEKLTELRAQKGVTQDDIAQALSISNKTVSKWENGASMPDLSMLVMLAEYYGVTTDALLGLAEDQRRTTREMIGHEFRGLGRKEAVLKAFETVGAIIPATFGTFAKENDDVNDGIEVYPKPSVWRSKIATHEFFEFTVNSEETNLAVMLLRNASDFAWLNDSDKQKKLVKFFSLLAAEDTLSILYFIHSADCSESFTSDYIAAHTKVTEERVTDILDEFCSIGICTSIVAHLTEKEIKLYEFFGDGIVLSILSLAYEKMYGRDCYNYNYNGRSKMIGGK